MVNKMIIEKKPQRATPGISSNNHPASSNE